jgi:hypothetical protein
LHFSFIKVIEWKKLHDGDKPVFDEVTVPSGERIDEVHVDTLTFKYNLQEGECRLPNGKAAVVNTDYDEDASKDTVAKCATKCDGDNNCLAYSVGFAKKCRTFKNKVEGKLGYIRNKRTW